MLPTIILSIREITPAQKFDFYKLYSSIENVENIENEKIKNDLVSLSDNIVNMSKYALSKLLVYIYAFKMKVCIK